MSSPWSSPMRTADLLDPVVALRGGWVDELSADETALVDPFGRGVLPLPAMIETEIQREAMLELVERLYARGGEAALRDPAFVLHACVEDVCASGAVREGLCRLAVSLAKTSGCHLKISFARPRKTGCRSSAGCTRPSAGHRCSIGSPSRGRSVRSTR